ncbi:NAD(P)H-hydrate epimerase [Natronoarchaeum philippinense]|uniref:Bifunctional NAD(P)H-hydrate repair enzyme n=1 Tax=Natronoarchaeum philippinense TaxID=558529 RepID=A0A285N3C8_NATPI|nr:NAD(P)H-hydrate dehydratase [Natronoarchaeum philippinense]SNZ03984.1 NAD(P)H-hydrate epimerase [Natronoarchaeum philippinense]
MITSDRMAAVDANAAALGVPRKQLMESSGNAVARVVREYADPGATVAVVAGRGNNGGDAFVAARFLDQYDVSVHLLGRAETIGTEIARENWDALAAGEYETVEIKDSRSIDLPDADVIVDAMLGTGVTGALREPAATAAGAINDAEATVIAVDVPSGVDADTGAAPGTAVEADHVVTFHDQKPGLSDLDADVTVADIGIPEAAELFVERGDLLALDRDPQSHKGDHGEVLVIGGGPYSGAPALAARAAFRAGADLVRVAVPESIASDVRSFSENFIVRPLTGEALAPGHVDELLDLAAEQDAVLIGPGLGDAEVTRDAVGEFLASYDGRAVVDADALDAVPEVETDADLVCTPHQGELRSMGGPAVDDWEDRSDAVASFAAEVDATLLVKGAYDVISDGETTRVNRTGNPGMTVGGTGDVLAGVTSALVSALDDPVQAAGVAAYANGRAGDLAVDEHGYGLVATDLPPLVADALWDDTA